VCNNGNESVLALRRLQQAERLAGIFVARRHQHDYIGTENVEQSTYLSGQLRYIAYLSVTPERIINEYCGILNIDNIIGDLHWIMISNLRKLNYLH